MVCVVHVAPVELQKSDNRSQVWARRIVADIRRDITAVRSQTHRRIQEKLRLASQRRHRDKSLHQKLWHMVYGLWFIVYG